MAEPKQYGSEGQAKALLPTDKPDAATVEDFHTNADTDVRSESLHHTLGPGAGQASPGNHTHNGGDSELLLDGMTVSGSRGGVSALPSIIAALVRLGLTDQSTP